MCRDLKMSKTVRTHGSHWYKTVGGSIEDRGEIEGVIIIQHSSVGDRADFEGRQSRGSEKERLKNVNTSKEFIYHPGRFYIICRDSTGGMSISEEIFCSNLENEYCENISRYLS